MYIMSPEEKRDPYGYLIYYLDIEDHWTPHVIDYTDEELRSRLIKPNEIITQ